MENKTDQWAVFCSKLSKPALIADIEAQRAKGVDRPTIELESQYDTISHSFVTYQVIWEGLLLIATYADQTFECLDLSTICFQFLHQ
jgi:hypothetical protein